MNTNNALSFSCPRIKGLDEAEQAILRKLWDQLIKVQPKNALIDNYYDQHQFFRSLGIAVPPQFNYTHAALDWPSKAVQCLARKHLFDGFTLAGKTDPFDTSELLTINRFDLELSQAITACYKHAVSFITVTAGGEGEPDVVIQARDAKWATGIWNQRHRCLSAALTITDADKHGLATGFNIYLPDTVIQCAKIGATWETNRLPNPTGRVLVEPLVYDPQLGRPFGHSRISRTVRYLTDVAARTMIRAEVSAEFFSSPQRYALGVDLDAFAGENRWSAVIGRLLALTSNEDGQIPQVGTFPQISMEPHFTMYRQLAQNFCAATNLPQSQVGIFADNPASAEAMQAAEAALADEAEYQWRVFAPALRRTVENVVMVRDGLGAPPVDSWRVAVNWKPARYVSPQAAADSVVKLVQAMPQLGDSNVALRRAGFTQSEIDEINSVRDSAKADALFAQLRQESGAGVGDG